VARRNLTLQLDQERIRQAKIVAAKRGTSISGLVARASWSSWSPGTPATRRPGAARSSRWPSR
jgi:hypothetical protein